MLTLTGTPAASTLYEDRWGDGYLTIPGTRIPLELYPTGTAQPDGLIHGPPMIYVECTCPC